MDTRKAIYRKIDWRFLPLLFLCYVLSYMDRTNIGFAQLQMKSELGFSDLAYGFGAGIFFVSYCLCGIPSNLLLVRIGARRLISVSLIGWGVISAATMFIRTPNEFYAARFLLGIVEAGFYPGVIFYLSRWYPSYRRANALGIFTSAAVIAGVVSGLVSGAAIAYLNGLWTLRGWQWMFLVEGLPSIVTGFAVFFHLDDDLEGARWLTTAEKHELRTALREDAVLATDTKSLKKMLLEGKVYFLGLIYFFTIFNTYVLAFWQPTIIKGFGVSNVMAIGIYAAIPPLAAVVAKIWIGRHSDAKRELRWHFVVPAFCGAMGLFFLPFFPHTPLLAIACLTLATAGVHASIPIFWSVSGIYWSGTAAAAAIALINTMGNVAGAIGPWLLGWIKTFTGSFAAGIDLLGVLLALGAALMLVLLQNSGARDTRHSIAQL